MRLGREIKASAGIIIFLTIFYIMNPAHDSLLKLVEISGILLVTLMFFLASKKLGPRWRYIGTFSAALISAVLIGYAIRSESLSLIFIITVLMLLLLALISPYLLKLVRLEPKHELSFGDLLKIILLAIIITIYVFGIMFIVKLN